MALIKSCLQAACAPLHKGLGEGGARAAGLELSLGAGLDGATRRLFGVFRALREHPPEATGSADDGRGRRGRSALPQCLCAPESTVRVVCGAVTAINGSADARSLAFATARSRAIACSWLIGTPFMCQLLTHVPSGSIVVVQAVSG